MTSDTRRWYEQTLVDGTPSSDVTECHGGQRLECPLCGARTTVQRSGSWSMAHTGWCFPTRRLIGDVERRLHQYRLACIAQRRLSRWK